MGTVHVIPVAVHVRDATTRQEAFEFVERMLEMGDDQQVVVTFPNDKPDGEWWLRWVQGRPPEALDNQFSYDPDSGAIYREDQG
jgi:hypothetical protein